MGCCGSTDSEDKALRKILVKKRWKLVKLLGKGSFGCVYEVYDVKKDDGKTYAMKIEYLKSATGRLPQEAMVLEELAALKLNSHAAELRDKGKLDGRDNKPRQFIVMTLLGPDLDEMRKMAPNKCFSPGTCALVFLQGIEALEDLHTAGFVHRDIKPHNFMLGLGDNKNVIYLIDFGLAKKFVDKNGKLLPPRGAAPFRGTLRYCAADSHKGVEYGRHHDFWCWFYSVVEMRKGQLPWANVGFNVQSIFEAKKKVLPSKWLADVEPEYLQFYDNLTSLKYAIPPDYVRLKSFCTRMLDRLGLTKDSPMDWEAGGEYFNQFNVVKLLKMFRDDTSRDETSQHSQKSQKSERSERSQR